MSRSPTHSRSLNALLTALIWSELTSESILSKTVGRVKKHFFLGLLHIKERWRFKIERIILNPCSRAGFTFENVNYLNKYCNYYSYLFLKIIFWKTQRERKRNEKNEFEINSLFSLYCEKKRKRSDVASLRIAFSFKVFASLRFRFLFRKNFRLRFAFAIGFWSELDTLGKWTVFF